MGRHLKQGLSYFPFDVDFFDDDKIQFVSARFGLKGENIAMRLLVKVYKDKGYYYQWGEDEALLFAKGVGDGCQHSFVNDVVQELVKRGFFYKPIFDRLKILTSTGIQERYSQICKQLKRDVQIEDTLDCRRLTLVKRGVIRGETPDIPEEIPLKERKGKERKKKEMREKSVENESWLDDACMAYKTDRTTLLNFCDTWIEQATVKKKFEQYEVNPLIGFMLSDFEKEKSSAKKENGQTGKRNGHDIKNIVDAADEVLANAARNLDKRGNTG